MVKLSPDLDRLRAELSLGKREVNLRGCPPGAVAYLVARLQRATGRTTLLIVRDGDRARDLADGLNGLLAPGDELAPAVVYPRTSVSPYAGISPGHADGMDRLRALFRLSQGLGPQVVVAPIEAVALLTLPRERLARTADVLMTGESIDREAFLANLVAAGYRRSPVVEEPGTFAVRGGIIDVFPPLYARPTRVDLWGEQVDSLRAFDPESQRGLEEREELYVGPAREALLDETAIARGLGELRRLADAADIPTARMRAYADDLERGVLGVGMDFLLPAFYHEQESLLDYLPPEALVVLEDPGPLVEHLAKTHEKLQEQWSFSRTREMLVYEPERYSRPPERLMRQLSRWPRLALRPLLVEEDTSGPVHEVQLRTHQDLIRELGHAPGGERSLKPLATQIRAWQDEGLACAICCHGDGQAQRIVEMLGFHGIGVEDHAEPPRLDALDDMRDALSRVHLFRGALRAGFRHDEAGIVVVDEEEIFGRKRRAATRRAQQDLIPRLHELKPGDFVVHVEHGIGRFILLEKLVVGGIASDFLRIEYKTGSTLLLPVQNLDRIQRYVGGGEAAPTLDRLGSTTWHKRKGKVRKAVRDMAASLLTLYAERKALPGIQFSPPDESFRQFEATFPYDETPDQERAIADVMDDMSRPEPTERLVCGDVGYGKTEVAMRAAFRAVADGYQVAVLVPTTVLAEQHRQSFETRMGPHGINVAALSRFKSAAEQKEVIKDLAEGKVDVVVGTHRLLSKDLRFRKLGLIVIDEEHRFGVAHKEHLKQLRKNVDVLTLTATPIPRTLNMALSGLRDLSVIATPPQDRQAVRTLVTRGTDEVIREGIRRELARGGQVFFVHNRVKSIFERAREIEALVPEARLAVGHGQMEEASLERVMLSFVSGEANVLVSTTIVESGLDIPRANTMFIDRADTFGLAQLYQLRGRIGRSRERAYAYLLIPNPDGLEGDARKRIEVIQQFSDLGSGFHIASYDLEIRGSGDLLGADQSGSIQAVGYDMFAQMLEEAVLELKGEQPRLEVDTELRIQLPAFLPEEWLPEAVERVRLYRRLAACRTSEELDSLEDEMRDRFGALPEAAANLVQSLHVKRMASRLGVSELVFGESSLMLTLVPEGPISPERLVAYLNRRDCRFRLSADMQLRRPLSAPEWGLGLRLVREALRELWDYTASATELDPTPRRGAP